VSGSSGGAVERSCRCSAWAVASAATACKSDSGGSQGRIRTTPCPFGTNQIVSTDSGTPGLRKLGRMGERVTTTMSAHTPRRTSRSTKAAGSRSTAGSATASAMAPGAAGTRAKIDAITLWDTANRSASRRGDSGQKWEQRASSRLLQARGSVGTKTGRRIQAYTTSRHARAPLHHVARQRAKEQQGEYKHGIHEGLWVVSHKAPGTVPRGQTRRLVRAWHENGQQAERRFSTTASRKASTCSGTTTARRRGGQYHNGMLDGPISMGCNGRVV
jgi:hypothetical protein